MESQGSSRDRHANSSPVQRKPQLRPSLEEAYRSSSEEDSDHEDDPLNATDQPRSRKVSGMRIASYAERGEATKRLASGSKPSLAQVKRSLWQRRKCLLISLIFLVAFLLLITGGGIWIYKSAAKDGQSPPWYPAPLGGTVSTWQTSYEKAQILVDKMTLVEKVNITTGTGWMMDLCVGNTGAATAAGFPSLCLQDGPLGVRFADLISAFPAGITTGATWNKDLIYQRGRALGKEFRMKGVHVMLGPAMGPLGTLPAGGRNWEGFGSDPVLQGIAAAATIRGAQDEGVMATAKHYVLNEQEHFRQSFEWGLPNAMSSNIDDRTLHEIYVWPFAESVRAGVASVMCSYQMVNNSYACGNSKILNGILKDELGFQGFVQSDWGAQRSGVASALAGLDMSMPGDGVQMGDGKAFWGPQYTRAVLNGSVPINRLNDAVTRIVAAWYQLGQDDQVRFPGPNFSSWTKNETGLLHPASDDKTEVTVNQFKDVRGKGNASDGLIARQVAAEGSVLVKNVDNILPLSRGGGSNTTKLRVGIYGEDAGEGRGMNACVDRGCNQGTLASGWGSGSVDFEYLVTPIEALKQTFDADTVNISSYLNNSPPTNNDAETLKNQDLCLVFINSDGGEGYIADEGIRGDRNNLFSQKGGDALVQAVAPNCGDGKGNTVVVVHAIGPVILEGWIDLPGVKAVILANLPGEESGNALVDVLFGDENPSGKLPYTIGKSQSDYGAESQVLYYPNAAIPQKNFSSGFYTDYRYFDKYNITPRYEFGFGLSYTNFSITNLTITPTIPKSPFPSARPSGINAPSYDEKLPPPSQALFPKNFHKLNKYIYPYLSSINSIRTGHYPYPKGYDKKQIPSPAGGGEGGNPSLYEVHANVSVVLTNTGQLVGKEVVQMYVSYPAGVSDEGDAIDFPVKALRGFEKVELQPGNSSTVQLNLTRKDLSYWSTRKQNWVMPVDGAFTISLGTSSRVLPLQGEL